MLDIGWQELFIIAVLVIIVIGPKDLPRAMRTLAGWVRKARSLAREFQGGLDDMMHEAELDDVKKQIESARHLDIAGEIESAIDPTGDVSEDLDMTDIETDLDAAAPTEAAESKPAESKPAESKPAESKPAESKPAESKPAESKPAESKPAESKPAESAADAADNEEEDKKEARAAGKAGG